MDVMDSAMREAGDVSGDLSDLCRGNVAGRTSAEQITLFKSTGSALANMAAAELVLNNAL